MIVSRAQQYHSLLMVDLVLAEPGLHKQAAGGIASSIIHYVENYLAGKIDPNNKVASIIDILTPGLLWSVSPMLGILVKIAESFFGFDPGKILTNAVASLLPSIHAGEKLTSEQVDEHVQQAQNTVVPMDPSVLQKTQSLSLREAQIYKVALDEYIWQTKQAAGYRGPLTPALLRMMGMKHNTASLLSRAIGWILKAVLASAGLMVGGDIIYSLMHGVSGESSSGSNQDSEHATTTIAPVESHQTIFKVNPAYTEKKVNANGGWIEAIPPEQIGDRIIQWAQRIYPDPRLTPEAIKNSTDFQNLVEKIQQYNDHNTSGVTFMPPGSTSYKRVVDNFIDEVAEHLSTETPAKS